MKLNTKAHHCLLKCLPVSWLWILHSVVLLDFVYCSCGLTISGSKVAGSKAQVRTVISTKCSGRFVDEITVVSTSLIGTLTRPMRFSSLCFGSGS